MADKQNFGELLNKANTGEKVQVMSLLRDGQNIAAIMSKLVKPDIAPVHDSQGNRELNQIALSNFHNTSHSVSTNIRDSRTVMQMLPDMELPAQILTSSIISPKDMMSTELGYASKVDDLPSDVLGALIEITKTYFEEDYKIIPQLPKILKQVLFEKGSYPIAVIPENSIDEIINGNGVIRMESFSDSFDNTGQVKNVGILGRSDFATGSDRVATRKPGLAIENFTNVIPVNISSEIVFPFVKDISTYLSVTDNPNVLKLPIINTVLRESRVLQATRSPISEAFASRLTDAGLSSAIYKNNRQPYTPIVSVKTDDQLRRKSVGNPLVMHLPPEAVIPVYVPGSPDKHIGFFIILDANGNPINTSGEQDIYAQLHNANNNMATSLINQAKQQFGDNNVTGQNDTLFAAKLYGDMIEQDLLSRLRNGVCGDGVEISNQSEIYRIMLARTLAKKYTQLLYVPAEQMTYIAFKYNENGTGRSLMDDQKMLNSLRVALLVADVHASLRNSIGTTGITMKLDEEDPNPQKTIEESITEIAKTRSQLVPMGMSDPTDIVNWLGKNSFQIAFTGHPGIPDITLDKTERSSNYIKPDSDLSDNLRKQSIMGMALNPATVDATYEADFATSVTSNNLLLSKRVQQYQDLFVPQMSDNMRKVMMHSQKLINKLTEAINSNMEKIAEQVNGRAKNEEDKVTDTNKSSFVNSILRNFVVNFNVTLPSPNTVTLENQIAALETYQKGLELALDAWINDSWFTSDAVGDVANQVSMIKGVINAYYTRKWMADNGMMTELNRLTMLNEDGKPEMNLYEENIKHMDSLAISLSALLVGLKPIKDRGDTVATQLGGVEEGSTDSDSTEGDDANATDNTDDGLDGMDMDDVGDDPGAPASEPAATEDKAPTGDDKLAKEEEPKEDKPEKNLNGE